MKRNEITDDLHKQAEELLNSISVVNFFSDLGKVGFVGSYVFNAMVRRDIDFFVLTNDLPSYDKAVFATKKLLDSGKFQTIGFANCFDYEVLGKPKGYYWELVVGFQGYDWKFDVWYGNNKESHFVDAISTTEKIKKVLDKNPQRRKFLIDEKQKIIAGIYPKDKKYQIYRDLIGRELFI